jgi:hypothetical protein
MWIASERHGAIQCFVAPGAGDVLFLTPDFGRVLAAAIESTPGSEPSDAWTEQEWREPALSELDDDDLANLIGKWEMYDSQNIQGRLHEARCEHRRRQEKLPAQPGSREHAMARIEWELMQAIRKHPFWPTDLVHAAAIVTEEKGELDQSALDCTYHNGSVDSMAEEAEHIGAMAVRFLMHLYAGDYHVRPSGQVGTEPD